MVGTIERRATSAASVAAAIVQVRWLLALLVLVVTALNRVVLHAVDLPDDLGYLLVGRIASPPTQEWPWEAPWLVLPVLALAVFVARPRAWSWGLVVGTFVLPHVYPYRIGPLELWGVRLLELTGEVVPLLHAPLLLLLAVWAVLLAGRDDAEPGPPPPPAASRPPGP